MTLSDFIFKVKRFPMEEALKEAERLFSLSADELSFHAEQKKWEIVKYHYKNNNFYNKLIGPTLPTNWEDIPIITKQHLQGNLRDIVPAHLSLNNCYISNTSGSSGHPFFFAKDKFTHALTWQIIRKLYLSTGINPSDLQARFYGIPLEKWGYTKEIWKDKLLNRIRFPVFDLSDETLARFLEVFRQKKIYYVHGYTNSIVLFARYLIRKNIVLKDVCPTLKTCIVTSEVCTPEDKSLIEQAFHVGVVREYGASELCIIAFDQPDGLWQVNNKSLFTEIENGKQEGNLLCTSLYNQAFPMIKYRIGDIASLTANGQYINTLQGRTNDNIILPSGKVSAGFTFYYVSRSILESSGVLKEFIIKQTALDHFIFEVVTDGDLDPSVIEQIRKKAILYLEKGITIDIERKEFIERPASGKIKHFYSLLNK